MKSGKMQQSSRPAAELLLNLLLDRYEAPRARVRDITQPVDYNDVGGPAAQDDFHRVLQDAARAGGVALERTRLSRFTGELARVRLVDPESLYKFLVRAPSAVTAEQAHQAIQTAVPEILTDPFFREIEQEAVDAWRSNRSYLGLSSTQADELVKTLRLAHGIAHLAGRDIDHRTFSRRAVKDSKALEKAESRIAHLLKRRNPNLVGDDAREVLEASGIVRRAHLLQVKGPIHLSSGELRLGGTGDVFIGLPWSAVQQTALVHAVDYVITIENQTSFWRYSTEIKGNYLALLTDGFPARDVLSSMIHLVRAARLMAVDTPIYHWGDIDAGGLRIAAYLEDAFGVSIGLHLMDHTLASNLGTPLHSRKGLERIALRSGDIGKLARWLGTAEARMLEQEELDPKSPAPMKTTTC